jgi:hypothetical protein
LGKFNYCLYFHCKLSLKTKDERMRKIRTIKKERGEGRKEWEEGTKGR